MSFIEKKFIIHFTFYLLLLLFWSVILLGYNRTAGTGLALTTPYGLDGPGIESRWGGIFFRICRDEPWGPPSLLYNGYWVFTGG